MKKLLLVTIFLFFLTGAAIAQATVSDYGPSNNSVDADANDGFYIEFSESMDATTFTSSNVLVMGSKAGYYSGSFSNPSSAVLSFDSSSDFLPGELITVIVTTGVENSSNVAISSPFIFSFTVEVPEAGTGVYGADVTYSAGDSPEDILTADFNNDGDLDVAVSNTADATISVFINDGDGTYAAAVNYATGGTNVRSVVTADVDNDGYLDLIAANNLIAANSNIKVLTNDGDGTFTSAGDYGFGNPYLPSDLATGDVDGDGDIDLFATFDFDNTAGRYLNDGTGAFGSLNVYSVGTQPQDIQVGDIDNDNDLDVVVTNVNSDNITILTNNGSGALSAGSLTKSVGDSPRESILADFDGDNDLDFAVTNHNDGTVSVYLNQNTGTLSTSFTFANAYTSGDFPIGIAAVDFDADGDLDLFTTNSDSISVLTNNGSGVFAKSSSSYSIGASPRSLAFGDLTNNGEIDFVTANNTDDNISVLLMAQPPTVAAVSNQNGINVSASADITVTFSESMDGSSMVNSSLVVIGSVSGKIAGAISYDDPSKTITFNPTSDFLPGEKISLSLTNAIKNSIGVGLTSYVSSFIVAASGNGNFTYADSTTISNSLVRILNADVDGDGDDDLIAQGNSGIEVFKNTAGSYALFSQTSFSTVESLYPADLDNDGDVDLIIKKSGSNTITAVENDGSGSYTLRDTTTISSSSIRDFEIADFNGDGFADFSYLVGNQIFYAVPGNGDFSFGNQSFVTVGFTYNRIVVGDIDNDGDVDAIGFSGSESKFEVVLNDGDISFTKSTSYSGVTSTTSSFGYHPEMEDFDGDGYLDIVIPHASGYEIVLNDGDGTFGSAISYETGNYEIKQVTPFDYDGDGDLDLGMFTDNDSEEFLFAYNDGNGGFGNQSLFKFPNTESLSLYGIGTDKYVFSDYDGDNDLDLIAAVRGYNGETVYALGIAENVASGSATAPTAAASSVSTSAITSNSAKISWTNGDGARRLVLVKEGSAVDGTPVDESGYSPSTTLGSGSEIGTGNYAVYAGVSNSVIVNGLDPETTYHVQVFEMNGIPGSEKFYTNSAPTGNFTTAAPPTIWSKNDATVTFTKTANADPDLEANQDRITDYLWLTRGAKRGIYNAFAEAYYEKDGYTAPSGTMWAFGTTDNVNSLSFDTWYNTHGGSAPDIVGEDMVVYVEDGDLYFDIKFSEWGEDNGGSFSYTRSNGSAPTYKTQTFQDSAGYAVQFDGGNSLEDYFEIITSDDEYIIVGDRFTTEIWIKPDTTDLNQIFFSLYGPEIAMGINSSNQFYAFHSQDAISGSTITVTGTTTITQDQWYHVALTGETGGSLTLYVNGVEEATASVTDVSEDEDYGNYWYVGSDYGDDPFFGAVDELRIWKTVRTASEIRSFMHRPYEGVTGPLAAYWQFNEGSGDIYDGLNNYQGGASEDVAETWVSSDVPFGNGTVEESIDFQTGTATIGNAALSMADGFDNPVDVQVTEISSAPNQFPSGYSAGVGGKYFVINLFGDPGTFSANLTLTYGSGVVTSAQESNPSLLRLYKRSSSSTGAWTEIASATSANASTGVVTWNGITSFSQFVAVEYVAPPLEIQISDGADVVSYSDSTYTFASSFFDLIDDYADSTLIINSKSTLSGTLYLDQNSNGVYDSGTDNSLVADAEFNYTPSDTVKLRYSASTPGLETAVIKLQLGSKADSVSLDFFTVEGDPTIAGNADENGWYLLSNPFTTTIGDLLDEVWTQGAINSNAPNSDATMYTFSQDSSKYVAVTTDIDTTKLAAGQGLLVYLYEDDDLGDGQSDIDGGWPKTLTNYGSPFGTDINISIKNVDHDGVSGTTGSEGFALLGNPYGWPLSADSVITAIKAEDAIANSYVYRWDAVNKTYKILSSGAIEPYESFFVRVLTSGVTANLSFDYNDADISTPEKRVIDEPFEFTLVHSESGLKSSSFLRFDEKAKEGIDPYDGYYLGSYASNYANLYTSVDDQVLSINNLPFGLESKEFPMYLDGTLSGEFKLDWDSNKIPEGWDIELENVATGEITNLKDQVSYKFNFNLKSKDQETTVPFNPIKARKKSAKESTPNFILKVSSPLAIGIEDELALPDRVELHQNYPNPFNPSSTIKFGLPASGKVQLEVFDILGRKVATLINNEQKAAGRYTIQFNANNLASGMYLYRLKVGSKIIIKKMTLIK